MSGRLVKLRNEETWTCFLPASFSLNLIPTRRLPPRLSDKSINKDYTIKIEAVYRRDYKRSNDIRNDRKPELIYINFQWRLFTTTEANVIFCSLA